MKFSKADKNYPPQTDENFISRWSRLKQGVDNETQVPTDSLPAQAVEETEKQLPTDTDMPPIESLTEDSDYSCFLSPKVSEALRKQALRKLFHSPGFNIRDGLDDYDGEYTQFATLGDIVTADMRHQMEREAREKIQQLADSDAEMENTMIEESASDHEHEPETLMAEADIDDDVEDEHEV